jgi:hypothetical protein
MRNSCITNLLEILREEVTANLAKAVTDSGEGYIAVEQVRIPNYFQPEDGKITKTIDLTSLMHHGVRTVDGNYYPYDELPVDFLVCLLKFTDVVYK